MKTLDEYIDLSDQSEIIDATTLRAHVGEVLSQAALGKSFTVLRKGETVCHIVPPGQASQLTVEIGPDGQLPDCLKSSP